ncbi:hypothetical protein M9Y10_038303 [Tritrichomonas musculus]|uniref:Uncharacterized protein n=1 Tax=Tritrichomonas musculus TaxID=1915356 RepID=A0ABR2K816_9EUKA
MLKQSDFPHEKVTESIGNERYIDDLDDLIPKREYTRDDPDFKRYFTPSAFDPPKEHIIKPISDEYLNHLNSCARTERFKNEPKVEHRSSQRFYSKPKIRAIPKSQLSKSNYVITTPLDDLQNRRKLANYMEKSENQTSYYWNPEYKEPPIIKKNTYEGPQSHPKKPRKNTAYIDRKETRSVRLRNQAVKQKLAVINERQYQKEMEDKMYFDHSMKVNKEMTPYINFVNSLEKIPPGGVEKKLKDARKAERKNANGLKESISIAKEAPLISLREAVFVELKSELNKMTKEEKEEKEKIEKEKYENRGKYKAKCFELWNPDLNC